MTSYHSLQSQPVAIKTMIFSFLDGKTIYLCQSVCKEWRNIITDTAFDEIWKKICLFHCPHLNFKLSGHVTSWKSIWEKIIKYKYLVLAKQDVNMTDVVKFLKQTGLKNVDTHAGNVTVPNLETLLGYHAVVVYGDADSFVNGSKIGDVLADYIDQGGGVVDMPFSNCSNCSGRVEGRFLKGGYHPIQPGPQEQGTRFDELKIHEPDHFLVQGVTHFDGGQCSYHSSGKVDTQATLIAEWGSSTNFRGVPLIVEKLCFKGRVVCLNFYPGPASKISDSLWNPNTHGNRLLVNALLYVANETNTIIKTEKKSKFFNFL